MRTQALLNIAALYVLCAFRAIAADAPATVFDLHEWKLQIPGPKEVKELKNYSSNYLHLAGKDEMCFHLDAAEKGTTPNTHFVRSELRHLPNWKVTETRFLSAEVRVDSHLDPDKVTVLQIHGITDQGENAPPLLRIAVHNGDLVAVIKTSAEGNKHDTVMLQKGLGAGWASVAISVKASQLKVHVNNQEKVNRSLSFWKFSNYFKAGCYPQATTGTVDVVFLKLMVK